MDTAIAGGLAAGFVLAVVVLLVYRKMLSPNSAELAQFQQQVLANLDTLMDAQVQQRFMSEELGKQLRLVSQDIETRQEKQAELLQYSFAQSRTESQQAANGLQQVIVGQFTQGNQLQSEKLNQFSETLHRTNTLIQDQLTQMRLSVEKKLKDIQEDNASKLELMRKTVDEKLHATLETRLGESFKQVSERLEQVYKGLGEMQTLATGVGDLKRVLTNVKTRGTWGEVQLQALLEQVLTPSQFGKNIKPVPGSNNIVEFAVRLPGKEDDQPPPFGYDAWIG